ncbi:MAG: glycosyltransferase [Thiovulaceae bacterium]|nr:glycosyltransferase [Sulfurimonadaceae bacterium]
MKKILFYTSFITVGGGLQKVSVDYLRLLVDHQYKVDLIVDFNMGEELLTFEEMLPKEVSCQYIKSEKISKFIYYFRTLGKRYKVFIIFLYIFMIMADFYYYHAKVKKIVQNGNYDFTISFYQFLPAYLTDNKSMKHMIWLHGSVEHFFGGITKIFKNRYEKKLNRYDYIVTIADEMKEQLENFYPNISKNKIQRIYNPFDFQNIKVQADKKLLDEEDIKLLQDDYICTVSRLDENQKDITTLILAYEKLWQEKKISCKLYIIGDGPHKKMLEDFVQDKKLSKKIIFLGKKINPFIWMKHTDIFILSSKFEGLPTVLIEAMALETFVISSDCKTGPKEILKSGECGELFEVGNIDELASKIYLVVNDEKYRISKIRQASQRIKEFDQTIVIKQLLTIFENNK